MLRLSCTRATIIAAVVISNAPTRMLKIPPALSKPPLPWSIFLPLYNLVLWWAVVDLNHWPLACEASALTTELTAPHHSYLIPKSGQKSTKARGIFIVLDCAKKPNAPCFALVSDYIHMLLKQSRKCPIYADDLQFQCLLHTQSLGKLREELYPSY